MTQPQQALEKKRSVSPFVIFGLAVIYVFSPIDIIPDIPVIGWVDDSFILSAASLHLLEKGLGIRSQLLLSLLRFLKWTVIILGAIAIALMVLAGVAIYKLIFG